MNTIQSLNFNGIDIQVCGTLENPTFNCQQILIKVLGYNKSNDCRFYKDNKTNIQYVTDVFIKNVQKLYFNERGLLKCLSVSQKPQAATLKQQITELLINMRTGVNNNQTADIVPEIASIPMIQSNLSNAMIQPNNNKKQQQNVTKNNLDCIDINDIPSELLVVYSISIGNYKGDPDAMVYVGSAINIKKRILQHQRNSTNKPVKQAYIDKKYIEIKVLGIYNYKPAN